MKLSLDLEQSNKQIEKMIAEVLVGELNILLGQVSRKIEQPVKTLVIDSIKKGPEYQSMVASAGKLRGGLGLIDPVQRLEQILNAWGRSLAVRLDPIKVVGSRFSGGFTLEMIDSSYEEVINLSASNFISEGDFLIPWLEWLLLAGKERVVQGYKITYNLSRSQQGRSRTGIALMVPGSSGWSVPAAFAGQQGNNFVTRAIARVQDQIQELIEKEMSK